MNPLTAFKLNNTALSPGESLSLFLKISKLSGVAHKNILLRLIHGEIYTKERLHRFGMIDSPKCPRCDEIETLMHKFCDCDYVRRIWNKAAEVVGTTRNNDQAKDILAISSNGTTNLTLNAEIILRIQYLKDDSDYLIHPNNFVAMALKDLTRKEGNLRTKRDLVDLLR